MKHDVAFHRAAQARIKQAITNANAEILRINGNRMAHQKDERIKVIRAGLTADIAGVRRAMAEASQLAKRELAGPISDPARNAACRQIVAINSLADQQYLEFIKGVSDPLGRIIVARALSAAEALT